LRTKLFTEAPARALTVRQFAALQARVVQFGNKVAEAQQG
jgi:hypothetical protein